MLDRDAALGAVSGYIKQAADSGDLGVVLSGAAATAAQQLLAASDPVRDIGAAHALGTLHWLRYMGLPDGQDQDDLHAAVKYFAIVFPSNPDAVPDQLRGFFQATPPPAVDPRADPQGALDRAIALVDSYQQTGAVPLLTEAVSVLRALYAALPPSHPGRVVVLSNLGTALQQLFEGTGDTAVLDEAIRAGRAAVALMDPADPGRAVAVSMLGNSLLRLFDRTADTGVLAEAVQVGREAVAATPDGHPFRGGILSGLGTALEALGTHTGDTAVLTEAVQVNRDAVAATPEDDPSRPQYLTNLCLAAQALSERTGDMSMLTEAIQAERDAVAGAAEDDPLRGRFLSNLGAALMVLHKRTGDAGVLSEAVQAARGAVAATPAGSPDRPGRLNNLGNALREQFERTGQIALLEEAQRVTRDAVDATPADHPDRRLYLTNLGNTGQRRFEHTGDTAALEQGVQAHRDAVAAAPPDDPRRGMYLSNLGNTLYLMYERTGNTRFLDEAVQADRDAVAAVAPDHPDRASYLSNLGAVLRSLSDRTGDDALLDEAVQADRDAVDATPVGHASRGSYLNNLGVALHSLFGHREEVPVLRESVQAFRDAIAVTPPGHPGRAGYLSNLSDVLRAVAERDGDAATLDAAIQAGRDGVAGTPPGHPDRASYLNVLGYALRARYLATGDTAALAEARSCCTEAAATSTARPTVRINSYRMVAALSHEPGGSPGDGLAAVEAAVGLLPQVAPRALVRADREHSLGELAALAGEAAAAAAAAGRPDRGVELLEQTRGVLVADSLDARSSDLARLRTAHPGLAAEFAGLRDQMDTLDHPVAAAPGGPPGQEVDLSRARQQIYTAWDDLLTRVRAAPDFETFLEPPGIGQLAAQVTAGPVIFVYASAVRCDALILTGDPASPVQLVPLAPLTSADTSEKIRDLLVTEALAGAPDADPVVRIAAQGTILDILAWIWDTITGPVLAALGHSSAPADAGSWPQVWWCPVGLLAYLPLHAAGHHADVAAGRPHPRTALDRVISSYTTTVRGLGWARAQHQDPDVDSTLIVAVPDAPGAAPLTGVTAEASELGTLIPRAQVLPHPERGTVLDALPGHRVAHFACHGYADLADPAMSRLILYDYQTAPLTVGDVSALHLTGGLAYLSACSTAVTSPQLANEAVHITGAFHLAGYQHVVGTLWPINDVTASELARDFYGRLTRHGAQAPDTGLAAAALHHGARQIRAAYPRTPTLWAAHTHTGP